MRKNKFLTKLSSAQYVRKTYVHIWPANNLTLKQKKIFLKRTKLFSTELGFLLKKKNLSNLFSLKYRGLYEASGLAPLVSLTPVTGISRTTVKKVNGLKFFKQKRFVNKLEKFSEANMFFQKSFWFLKKTALIPGGTRITRTKSFNLVKKNSLKTLKVYLKSILKSKMQKLLLRTNKLMGFRHTWGFVHAVESLPIVFMQKAFLFKNAFQVLPVLAQQLRVNSTKHLAMPYKQMKPGDVFTNKSVNKSFYKLMWAQKILKI